MKIIIDGRELKLVVLDFETYYSSTYSLALKAYNTTQYIRDPQFKVHGVGVLFDRGDYHWFTNDVRFYLSSIDWSNSAILAQNTPFDAAILEEHFGIRPAFHLDTAAMSRLHWGASYLHNLNAICTRYGMAGKTLGQNLADTKGVYDLPPDVLERLGVYCEEDCENTLAIFERMYPHVPDHELQLIDLTTRLFTQSPLIIDENLIHEEINAERDGKTRLMEEAGVVDPAVLLSNDKFAQLLKDSGIDPPTKISPKTGKVAWAFASTDAGFQLMLESDDMFIRALAEARKAVKSTIGETRAARILACSSGGRTLPVGLTYAAAKTHRWGGTNKINFQNFPRARYLPGGKIDPNSARLRRSILAPEGHVIIVCDLSQIEVRVLAWWTGQYDLLDDFANSVDIYKKMASRVFGVPFNEVTKEQRFIGKVLILGLGYGMGAAKLMMTLRLGLMGGKVELDLDEAQRYVQIYRETYVMVPHGWKIAGNMLRVMAFGGELSHNGVTATKGRLTFPNGTHINYPGMTFDSESGNYSYQGLRGPTKIYGALLVENIVQKLSRDVIGGHLINVDKLPNAQVVMTTHDEIGAVGKEAEAQEIYDAMHAIMCTPPEWMPDIPLAAEGGFAREYSK